MRRSLEAWGNRRWITWPRARRRQPGAIVWSSDRAHICNYEWEVKRMLKWAVVFLIIAIVAAILGFGVLSGVAATIAEILFIVFLILLIVSFIFGWSGRHGA